MNNNDRIYRSFEEFERDELRRMETLGASVDEMIDAIFGQESSASAAAGTAPGRAGTTRTKNRKNRQKNGSNAARTIATSWLRGYNSAPWRATLPPRAIVPNIWPWALAVGLLAGFLVGREMGPRSGTAESEGGEAAPSAAAAAAAAPSGGAPSKVYKAEAEFPAGWMKSPELTAVAGVS